LGFGIWLKYKDKDVGIIVKEIMRAIEYEIAAPTFGRFAMTNANI